MHRYLALGTAAATVGVPNIAIHGGEEEVLVVGGGMLYCIVCTLCEDDSGSMDG